MALFLALARKRDAENSEAFPDASMNRFIESSVSCACLTSHNLDHGLDLDLLVGEHG